MSRDTTHDEAHRQSLVLAYDRLANLNNSLRNSLTSERYYFWSVKINQTKREIDSILELLGELVVLPEMDEDELLAELGL